jgi:DNA repair exonuclease SbcCD ATPase subunit
MLKIKSITAKNFLSIGNVTQSVNLDRTDLTLILGENLDLGGDDSGSRNGVGKTAILHAVSYALYGAALTSIKKDNLINRTNGKNMLVTVEFEKDGVEYRIERGRKPNVMRFYVGSVEQQVTDESQGDSRETQTVIERLLCMSHTMFKHIVALNTYTEPFLSLKANEQREIIEQLLGITLLSEKADLLKERVRNSKDSITQEEFRIKATNDANKRIEEQITALKRRQTMWLTKHTSDCSDLVAAYDQLNQIDIDVEIASHKSLALYNQKKTTIDTIVASSKRTTTDLAKEEKTSAKLALEITSLQDHKCYACGQDMHDQTHESVLAAKIKLLDESNSQIATYKEQISAYASEILKLGDIGIAPTVFYDSESDAVEHRSSLASLQTQLNTKNAEIDPYADQISEMIRTALEVVSYDTINSLTSMKDHEEFLLKLLTNKDSFIRKKIIDQNLSYLNLRLGYYLEKIGLPHQVEFQNDLTVSIEELGRDLDFFNLSRGESNRLILSLSLAFRDVWESLYQKINVLYIDELLDSGMDSSGMESALAILKKSSRDGKKSVWLVSHRDELVARVENILRVTKSNGFTTYGSDVEI